MGRKKDDTIWPVMKPDDVWREQLTDEQFYVTRQAGTERAFTGPNWDAKDEGVYHCNTITYRLYRSIIINVAKDRV